MLPIPDGARQQGRKSPFFFLPRCSFYSWALLLLFFFVLCFFFFSWSSKNTNVGFLFRIGKTEAKRVIVVLLDSCLLSFYHCVHIFAFFEFQLCHKAVQLFSLPPAHVCVFFFPYLLFFCSFIVFQLRLSVPDVAKK